MNRPVHFEIHASEPEKLAKFYSDLFGWEIKEWLIPGVEMAQENRYWAVVTGPSDGVGPDGKPVIGINGGIVQRRGASPSQGAAVGAFVCTMDVENLDVSMQKAVALGGSVALPKMPIPSVGWLGYCIDIDGNIFGMMQADTEAA